MDHGSFYYSVHTVACYFILCRCLALPLVWTSSSKIGVLRRCSEGHFQHLKKNGTNWNGSQKTPLVNMNKHIKESVENTEQLHL